MVLCQAPTFNPTGTNCAPTTFCIATGSACGNATAHQDPTKYCGDSGSFCDWGTSGNCIAKYPIGHACNLSVYYGADCQSSNCVSSVCAAPPTTSTSAPPTIVYEGTACTLTSPCHASLSCVSGTCQKWWANTASCNTALDCTPGNVCVASACVAQTGTVIGAACTADTGCNAGAVTNAKCFCNSPNAAAGVCGVPDLVNGAAMTAAAVTNCQALYNAYKNAGTITSSNAVAELTNYACVMSCAYLNGPSTVTKAWQANNGVIAYSASTTGTTNNCIYTAPSKCGNPTTTGPTKGSATSVVASLFLTVFALLF